MNDSTPHPDDLPPPDAMHSAEAIEKALRSEMFDDLFDALETLYIKCNASGRRIFLKDWPLVATYIFGQDLVTFDTEGGADIAARGMLEEEAEERRLYLIEVMSTLSERAIHEGALEKDYVTEVMDELGRELAGYIFAREILERVKPSRRPAAASDPGAAETNSPQTTE